MAGVVAAVDSNRRAAWDIRFRPAARCRFARSCVRRACGQESRAHAGRFRCRDSRIRVAARGRIRVRVPVGRSHVPLPCRDCSWTSRDFTVSAIIPPKVQRIDAHYEYPAFTGLPPRDEAMAATSTRRWHSRRAPRAHRQASGIRGARASGGAAATPPPGRRHPARNGARARERRRLWLQPADADRCAAAATEYFIRLMDDRPPDAGSCVPTATSSRSLRSKKSRS
jgi:hypothetical protein